MENVTENVRTKISKTLVKMVGQHVKFALPKSVKSFMVSNYIE